MIYKEIYKVLKADRCSQAGKENFEAGQGGAERKELRLPSIFHASTALSDLNKNLSWFKLRDLNIQGLSERNQMST